MKSLRKRYKKVVKAYVKAFVKKFDLQFDGFNSDFTYMSISEYDVSIFDIMDVIDNDIDFELFTEWYDFVQKNKVSISLQCYSDERKHWLYVTGFNFDVLIFQNEMIAKYSTK